MPPSASCSRSLSPHWPTRSLEPPPRTRLSGAAEIPAAGGHATARGVAALYEIFTGRGRADGRQLLSAQAAERVREGQGSCRDLVLGSAFEHDTEMGLGLWLSGQNSSYGPNPRAFGHDGFGGSFGLADPEAGISIGYVMNRMGAHIADDPRKMALIDAVYKVGVPSA